MTLRVLPAVFLLLAWVSNHAASGFRLTGTGSGGAGGMKISNAAASGKKAGGGMTINMGAASGQKDKKDMLRKGMLGNKGLVDAVVKENFYKAPLTGHVLENLDQWFVQTCRNTNSTFGLPCAWDEETFAQRFMQDAPTDEMAKVMLNEFGGIPCNNLPSLTVLTAQKIQEKLRKQGMAVFKQLDLNGDGVVETGDDLQACQKILQMKDANTADPDGIAAFEGLKWACDPCSFTDAADAEYGDQIYHASEAFKQAGFSCTKMTELRKPRAQNYLNSNCAGEIYKEKEKEKTQIDKINEKTKDSKVTGVRVAGKVLSGGATVAGKASEKISNMATMWR